MTSFYVQPVVRRAMPRVMRVQQTTLIEGAQADKTPGFVYTLPVLGARSPWQFAIFHAFLPVIPVKDTPDYLLSWEPAQTAYLSGEIVPLTWTLTRADGQAVELPTAAAIYAIDANGNVTTLATSVDSSVPAMSLQLSALFPVNFGTYYVLCTVTTAEGELRAARQLLVVEEF